MALPVVMSMLVSLVYNMVDTWFIAQTQDTALVAGVSLCAPMFTLMVAMGDIFGLGGSCWGRARSSGYAMSAPSAAMVRCSGAC